MCVVCDRFRAHKNMATHNTSQEFDVLTVTSAIQELQHEIFHLRRSNKELSDVDPNGDDQVGRFALEPYLFSILENLSRLLGCS